MEVHLVRLIAAAELLGIRKAQQTRLSECGEHSVWILLGLLVFVDLGREYLVRDITRQFDEIASFLAGHQAFDGHGRLLAR